MRIFIAAVVLCGAAACAESEAEVPEPPTEADVVDPQVADPEGQIQAGQLCEVPADAEGPCALACDADAVIDAYVPEGTCTIYSCPLVDGTTIRTGGCNFGE